MRLRDHARQQPSRLRARGSAVVVGLSALALTGCGLNNKFTDGYLPPPATEGADRVKNLWLGSWIAAIAVGLVVVGLVLWCIVMYRRRKDATGLPPQLRYNVPIEILYTVVPVMMVAVLFYYTARDEAALLDTSKPADVTINVVGKQWSWDFNYMDEDVHEAGTHAQLTGEPGVEEELPTLYLPVGKRVEFVLTSRDVIHSFWVPAFLQKLDMVPGRVNRFQVMPTEEGTYAGKCAELCGAYHSQMLFNVKVVPEAEYNQHIAELKAKGNTGLLDNGVSREEIMKIDEDKIQTGTEN
ncbi:aa3-type cytochrome oxidase subunit II [Actinomycetota bacterium]